VRLFTQLERNNCSFVPALAVARYDPLS